MAASHLRCWLAASRYIPLMRANGDAPSWGARRAARRRCCTGCGVTRGSTILGSDWLALFVNLRGRRITQDEVIDRLFLGKVTDRQAEHAIHRGVLARMGEAG